jgi:hypothetical protein
MSLVRLPCTMTVVPTFTRAYLLIWECAFGQLNVPFGAESKSLSFSLSVRA